MYWHFLKKPSDDWKNGCHYQFIRQTIDPGSNPRAARKSCEVYPGLGILQPQWNPYPTLTPPSCWVRHVRSIGGPQYGLAVCHHSRRSGRRPQQQNPTWEWRQHSWAEFPMMVIHHTHLPLHFFHRWRPSGGSWCCTTTHSDAIYNIHPT